MCDKCYMDIKNCTNDEIKDTKGDYEIFITTKVRVFTFMDKTLLHDLSINLSVWLDCLLE